MFLQLCAFLFTLSVMPIPSILAGPACARNHRNQADCMTECSARWGWPGSTMGTDPWGNVMSPAEATAISSVIALACGSSITPSSSPSTTVITTTVSTSSTSPATCISASSASSATLGTSTRSGTTSASSGGFVPSSTPTQVSSTVSTLSVSSTVSTSSVSSTVSITSDSSSSSFTTSTQISSLSSSPPESSSTTSISPSPDPISTSTPTSTFTFTSTSTTPSPSSSATSQPSTSSSPGTSSSDIATYLSTQNTARSQHGASPLSWNDTLASAAQTWANKCVFKHSGGTLGPFGENLAAGTGNSYNISSAVQSWTNEASQYNSGNPQPSHFTQVVWKASTQVGCALQSCNGIFSASFGQAKFYVCEYYPQGNVIGAFA
ncbi:CAP domain-containing protein [Phellopilus nigrolimitatus]|nr:CAP domain-containing protein [Phellopilus nigrolimitatus]